MGKFNKKMKYIDFSKLKYFDFSKLKSQPDIFCLPYFLKHFSKHNSLPLMPKIKKKD